MKSFITSVLVALTLFLGACSSDTDDTTPEGPVGPTLISIELQPATVTLAIGTTQKFVVWGTYSDDTEKEVTDTVTWSLREDSGVIAPVTDSLSFVKAISQGSETLIATSGSVTDSALVIVNNTGLVSLEITPQDADIKIKYTEEYTVTGIYSDHSQDLTDEANWTIASEDVATFDMSTGVRRVGGVSVGLTTVTASYDGQSNTADISVYDDSIQITSLDVIPSDLVIFAGDKRQYYANVHYDNGDVIRVPNALVAFEVLEDKYDIIRFGNTNLDRGELEAVSIGIASVRLTYNSVSGTSTVKVIDSFKEILVTPSAKTLKVGETLQLFTYIVEKDDNLVSISPDNTDLSYKSSLPNVIDVSDLNDANKGTLFALSVGQSVVTATFEYQGEKYEAISRIEVE